MGPIPQYYHKNYHKYYHNLLKTSTATLRRRIRKVGFDREMATIAQWRYLSSGDSETLRTEAEDKGLDSNGDVETLHAKLQDSGNGRTIEEWKLSYLLALTLSKGGNYRIL